MNSLIEKISRIFDYLSTQTRMGLLMLVGLVTVIVILFTLGRYTLVDHDFYTVLADRQQLREVELSVNRGTIFATLDPLRSGPNDTLQNTILATTSITQDLKVDPSASCNKTLLETFLVDIVYEHLCQNRSQASCFDNVLKFTNNYTLPENFSFSKDVIIDFLTPTVREQVNRVYKTRILFATNLSGEVINALLAIGNPGIVVV
jgi:cell division protein FtsI/penicillin-binding protein 2